MIAYGHITDKINKMRIEDISKKEASQILKSNKILVKSLPGYGNIGLNRKEILACDNKECSIKIIDWCYNKKITHALIHLFKTKSAIRKITHALIRLFKTKGVIKKITQIIYTYVNSFI